MEAMEEIGLVEEAKEIKRKRSELKERLSELKRRYSSGELDREEYEREVRRVWRVIRRVIGKAMDKAVVLEDLYLAKAVAQKDPSLLQEISLLFGRKEGDEEKRERMEEGAEEKWERIRRLVHEKNQRTGSSQAQSVRR